MTERKRFDIAESKQMILERDEYRCTYPGCTERAINLAHGISKSKVNLRMYGEDIVNHPYNLFSVCDNLEHNAYFNISGKEYQKEKLIALIEYVPGLTSRKVWMMINSDLDYRIYKE